MSDYLVYNLLIALRYIEGLSYTKIATADTKFSPKTIDEFLDRIRHIVTTPSNGEYSLIDFIRIAELLEEHELSLGSLLNQCMPDSRVQSPSPSVKSKR